MEVPIREEDAVNLAEVQAHRETRRKVEEEAKAAGLKVGCCRQDLCCRRKV